MTQDTINRIHKIYGIILSVVAAVAGILFIVSAWNIYQTGLANDVQPYTYATIGAAFSKIVIPVYACLVLVIGGIALDIALPRSKKKLAAEKNLPLILSRLQAKTDLDKCEEGLRASVEKQQKSRKLHATILTVLLVICGALFLSYACNPNNWAGIDQPTQFTPCMVRAVFALLICMALPFVYSIFAVFYSRHSMNKEIELMRQASAACPFKGERPAPKQMSIQTENIVRYGVLLFAVAIMVFGLCTGGTADVLAKAAAICTECVGLG